MADDFCKLVDRCLAGEHSAILELVDRHQRPVFGLCFRMLRHHQDAEDMAQETFVRALRSLSHWDRQRTFLPWLLAIAANRCRTLLSRRTKRPATTAFVEEPSDTTADGEPARRLREELQLAMGSLREDYRQAFVLFHEQEMSYAEIGAALECPVGTVKTWVHRARRELIERLRERGMLAEERHALRPV
ncbi:MAG TPA: RNA polymerase sigma factor [Pirellulales bacterium]|nr:RNA polymerase sigma factor [Pirellulales bacterium]